jgi:hypothetical protein
VEIVGKQSVIPMDGEILKGLLPLMSLPFRRICSCNSWLEEIILITGGTVLSDRIT